MLHMLFFALAAALLRAAVLFHACATAMLFNAIPEVEEKKKNTLTMTRTV